MSKMSQLSAELDELRRCGEALIGVAQSLKELFSEETAAQEAVPETEAEKPKTKPIQEEKKAFTLEEVRTILAEKSREGFTGQVKEILAKYGAKKLSEIDPSQYEAVVAEVEVLKDA